MQTPTLYSLTKHFSFHSTQRINQQKPKHILYQNSKTIHIHMNMSMKRSREDELTMVNCLMLLSQIGKSETLSSGRVYECKTCNRQFPSFQALGGHRASHKKPKLMVGDLLQVPVKPKKHECSICGVEFALGQALGGHMRRHRAEMESTTSTTTTTTSDDDQKVVEVVPVLKRSDSCKRVWGLDLNLMPHDNYLKLEW